MASYRILFSVDLYMTDDPVYGTAATGIPVEFTMEATDRAELAEKLRVAFGADTFTVSEPVF